MALWLGGVHAEVQDMLERSGLADDIGRALVALASANAHYITSATVTVDGGAYFL